MKARAAFLLFSLAITLASCQKLTGPAGGQSGVVIAKDRSCQVVLPSGWHERKEEGTAVLRAGEPGETALFMILRIHKEDLADNVTLKEQGRAYMDELRDNPLYEKVMITNGPVDCSIHGLPGLQYELDGVLKEGRTKFHYIITVVKGDKSFFRLVGTLLPSSVAKYRSGVEELTKSFTELP